jgi:hypothetical protein
LDEVSNNGRLLQNLTEKFKNDKEIVLAGVLISSISSICKSGIKKRQGNCSQSSQEKRNV